MMSESELRRHDNELYPMLEQSKLLQQHIAPLQDQFGISGAFYMEIFETGEAYYLTTLPQFTEQLNDSLIKIGPRFTILDYIKDLPWLGAFLGDSDQAVQKHRTETLLDTAKSHNLDHELLTVNKIMTERGLVLRVISYGAPSDHSQVNSQYLNNLSLIKKMNDYITNSLSPTLQKLPTLSPLDREQALAKYCFKKLQPVNLLQFNSSDTCAAFNKIRISPREQEVVYWYIQGKSNTEISKILNISAGTIRTYFERLKVKLGCYYKHQILIKLSELGYI